MLARVMVIVAAVTACWVAAVLGGLVGGLDAARWCAAGCIAVAALVMWAITPPQHRVRTPRYGIGRGVVRHPYPRFEQLASVISWAQRDRRYYDRVLTPLLDEISADGDEPAPVAALRTEVAEELGTFERRHRSWT